LAAALPKALAGRRREAGHLCAPADKLQEVAMKLWPQVATVPSSLSEDLYPEDAAAKLTAAAIQGLGHVDILINNAGGSRSFKDLHVSEEAWQEAITLNFHRPRQVADALIDQMIARKWAASSTSQARANPIT
jgi:3-oxoacyl-[acyl-carrier protein] reductase